jgi:hypothetical protein
MPFKRKRETGRGRERIARSYERKERERRERKEVENS